MEPQEHHANLCSKGCIIEAAVNSLNQLNLTICEIKRWISKRTAQQSDIWYSKSLSENLNSGAPNILLFRDPLIKHQSEEIYRLTTTNNCMKTEMRNLNDALLETEQQMAWNFEKKLRNKITKINSQVAVERLQLAREIGRLKKELETSDANTALQQIENELSDFARGDRKFDKYLSQVSTKVIRTVNDLSNQLFRTNEILKKSESEKLHLWNKNVILTSLLTEENNNKIHTEDVNCFGEQETHRVNLQIEREISTLFGADCTYLEKIKNKVERLEKDKKILLKEKIMKEKALSRNVSSVKTKLLIALIKNEKLNEKIKSLEYSVVTVSNSVKTDLSMQTENEVEQFQPFLDFEKEQLDVTNVISTSSQSEWNDKDDKAQLESELIIVQRQNNEMAAQLIMEKTTAQEALKEFERSTKEIERLENELEDVKLKRIILEQDFIKIKMENNKLHDAKVMDKKRIIFLGDESVKVRESLQMKVRLMKIRLNKIIGDLKKSNYKNNQYVETIRILEEEKIKLQNEVDVLIIRSEELVEEIKKISEQKSRVEIEKNEWTVDRKKLNDELRKLEYELEINQEKNNNSEQLSSALNQINIELQNKCTNNELQIQNLNNRLNEAENECELLKNRIKVISSTLSSLEINKIELETIICESKLQNNQLKDDQKIFDTKRVLKRELKKSQDEKEIQSTTNNSNVPKDVLKKELAKLIVGKSKEVLDMTGIFDQFIDKSRKTLLKILIDTDYELQTVKRELTKVKHEVGFLRTDLNNGKFGLKSLTYENSALKRELIKLREEKRLHYSASYESEKTLEK